MTVFCDQLKVVHRIPAVHQVIGPTAAHGVLGEACVDVECLQVSNTQSNLFTEDQLSVVMPLHSLTQQHQYVVMSHGNQL